MAAKELERVRPEFAQRASTALIKQLVDDLLSDKVLNDGEGESILEENPTRADKARCLIDTVRKKGNEASKKMIAHIHKRDSSLHTELGLGCDQPAPQPAELKPKTEWSATLIPTTKEFWEKKQNDTNIYPVTKNAIKKRVALLITNMEFTNPRLNRKGAEKDEENMEILLKTLGYQVLKHRNLTGKAIEDALIEFSRHESIQATDSVLVVIMSHGKLGAVLGVNSSHAHDNGQSDDPDEFAIDKIYKHLGTERCPALKDKPKIIVIQACRGEEAGAVLVCDSAKPCDVPQPSPPVSAAEEDLEDDALRTAHKEKDFIALLSCTPDTVSYRHPQKGSLLIQYIVDIFNNSAHEDDIEELFRKIMYRFENASIGKLKQMPTKDRCTLTRRFYFFPGL